MSKRFAEIFIDKSNKTLMQASQNIMPWRLAIVFASLCIALKNKDGWRY